MCLMKRMRIPPRLLSLCLFHASLAGAATSVWQGPGGNFTDGANWSAGVPTDVALFSGTVGVSPDITAPSNGLPASATSLQLNTIAFDAGAGFYTVALDGTARRAVTLTLAGDGISNASGVSQQIINTGSRLIFTNHASAGDVTLINQVSPIDLTPGEISFEGASSGGQAAIVNKNMASTLDISRLTTAGTTLGSVDGPGSIILGGKNLTLTASNGPHLISGIISGSGGSLTLNGTQALTLSGDNTFSGRTTINAGSIFLTGNLPGGVMVGPGGQLGGTGTAGAVVNNGMVAPEHLSTLHAASYSGPGTLAIDFENDLHSALDVAGTANVSGGRLLITQGLPFKSGSYSVVRAGTISGTFAAFDHPDSAFLTFNNHYTSNDVFVDIAENGKTFTSVAQNPNQTGVGTVLDVVKNAGTDPSSPPPLLQQAVDTITQLSAGQAQSAFSALSGDALTYFPSSNLRSASVLNHQMNERAHPAGGGMTAGLDGPVQVAYNGDIRDLGVLNASSPPNGAWVRGVGFFGHIDADASVGSPSAHSTTGGAQAGYDHAVGDYGLLGIAAGLASTHLNVDDRASSGQADTRQGGLYGSYTPGRWFLNASGAYSQADNTMTRGIDLPGIAAKADSSFKSRIYTGYGEAGYGFQPQDRLSIEPSLAIEFNHIDQDPFTESGAPGFDLAVDRQTIDSLVSSLGMRVARLFSPQGRHPLIAGVRGAWQHEYHEINNAMTAQFAETSVGHFIVQGTPQARNAAVLGLDFRLDLYRSFQTFANYALTLSTGRTDQMLLGGLSVKW
jgi:autotransporter-associated beta strand protein